MSVPPGQAGRRGAKVSVKIMAAVWNRYRVVISALRNPEIVSGFPGEQINRTRKARNERITRQCAASIAANLREGI